MGERTAKQVGIENPMKTKSTLLLVCLALFSAGFFYIFFMGSKHVPLLAEAAPYLEDPYDAVGSFAVLTASFLAVSNFIRVYLISRFNLPGRQIYILRSIRIISLCILATLAADGIAVLQFPPRLPPGTGEVLLFTGMIILLVLAVILLLLTGRALRQAGNPPASGPSEWDLFFKGNLTALNPRIHPWRFSAAFAFAAGLAVSLISDYWRRSRPHPGADGPGFPAHYSYRYSRLFYYSQRYRPLSGCAEVNLRAAGDIPGRTRQNPRLPTRCAAGQLRCTAGRPASPRRSTC